MAKTYTVSFVVTDGTTALEGAVVTFNSANHITDAEGKVMVEDVAVNTYNYTVELDGYNQKNSSRLCLGIPIYLP